MSSQDGSAMSAETSLSNESGSAAEVKHLCKICGDKGIGFNFGVQTCESCKAFFRRNALSKKEFKCPFENNCEISKTSRKYCQKCRLIKCLQVGMRKDLILTDEEKQRKKLKRHHGRSNSEGKYANKRQNSLFVLKQSESLQDFFHVFYNDNIQLVIDKIEGGFPIFPYEKLLDFVCNKTVHCEFEYLNQRMGSPGSQLVNGQLDLNRTENIKYEELNRACMILMPKCFQIDHQIVNILGAFQASEAQIITIIKMAKQLSSFRKLSIDDQIIVLKGSIREILPLWNVVVYDRQFNCIVYYNVGQTTESCTKINYDLINQFCSPQISSLYKQFIVSFQELLKNDINVFNLLMVIILFKPREASTQKEYLRNEYLTYLYILNTYLRQKYQDRSEAQSIFLKLLCKLEELYAISHIFFKCLDNIDTSQLTNFFKEVFNINF